MRTLKTRELVRPRTAHSRESRAAALTLSGRWFENCGFTAESQCWIDDSETGKITIYTTNPNQEENLTEDTL
jgi:hypothetical protein